MAIRKIRRIVGIEGVAAGAPCRVKLDVDCRVFALLFFCRLNGVLTKASDVVEDVRVYVNGLPQWDVKAADLLLEAERAGRPVAAGTLPLDFADPARADKVDESLTAFNLHGETSFEVELVLKAQAGGVVPSITGQRIFDGGQSVDPATGKVLKQAVRKFAMGKNAAAGWNDLDNISTRDAVQRISFIGANLPQEFIVEIDSDRHIEATAAELEEVYAPFGNSDPAGMQSLLFDFTERLDDFAIIRRNWNIRFRQANAENLRVLVQSITPGFL